MKIVVIVHPNSRKPRIVQGILGTFDIYVSQPAVDGRANEAVIASLAKYFQVRKSAVQLFLGTKSKRKVFKISKNTGLS